MARDSSSNETPQAVKTRRFLGWFAVFGKPGVTERFKTLLIVFLGLLAASMSVSINMLLPLKERVPYFVESDTVTGRVVKTDKAARQFKPGESNIRYFISQWVLDAMTIDSRTKEYLIPAAYLKTRGQARDELRDWLTKDKTLERLVDNPLLKRSVHIVSKSVVGDGVMLVRVELEERDGSNGQSKVIRKVMTIHYVLLPSEKEEELDDNPIGFFITHFVINDENS